MINAQIRDEVFALAAKFQELHLVICNSLIDDNDELKEKAEMMLREAKILVREL